MFHVVTSGQCWLDVEGADRRLLQPGDLARRLAYQSEAAFSRAFRRSIGVSPGTIRRNGQVTKSGVVSLEPSCPFQVRGRCRVVSWVRDTVPS